MKPFVHDDFLLETETARDLYHRVAKDLPVIDYHCHLSPELMAADHRFRSITEVWLEGDHYKWRAMRTNGVAERFCTGDASDWEKFEAWARTVPDTLRNPLYHWTHMELRRPFGIEEHLSPATARATFDRANERLQEAGFTAMGLLKQFRVAVVCSTDDATDTLEAHARLAQRKDPDTQVFPTWRPDRAVLVEDLPAWTAWLGKLEKGCTLSRLKFCVSWSTSQMTPRATSSVAAGTCTSCPTCTSGAAWTSTATTRMSNAAADRVGFLDVIAAWRAGRAAARAGIIAA